jgi:hypothetical protein
VRSSLALAAMAALIAVGACATGKLVDSGDGGGDASTGDGSVLGDGSACPQYDLTKDPKHCGSCTNACSASQVCSSGVCTDQCTAPQMKCADPDGGYACADLKSDPTHCGQCTTECTTADAGSLAPGPNNPDAGIPFDGGSGWSLGTPSCDAGACGTTCSNGMTACSDGICYDTQNFHDHCGDCSTACQAGTEWCNFGHCCPLGQMYCNGSCVDVLQNGSNCGSCGNTCSGSTPYCSNGVCTAACSPAGTRQAYNTMTSHTTTGCWTGNPCAQGTYSWTSTNGQSFINANEDVVCGGTTACVSHVGITTYELSSNCQGAWDVYCDTTKVGSIDTTGKACSGDAMTNGCSITFGNPLTCSSIRFVGTAGSVGACCGSTGYHSMITGVSAW